ncbi:hypothetical protein I4U23_019233 [Adineta vaga]|nr:hypothetical protein I4U23_019233 [Adineta vaga]
MEKSTEQLKYIQRISRQIRHYRTQLNQIYDDKLHLQLKQLESEYKQKIRCLTQHQQLEEERKQLINLTVKQSVKEDESYPLRSSDLVEILQETSDSYPSKPIQRSTNVMKNETFPKRSSSITCSHNIHVISPENKHRRLESARRNHDYEINRHLIIERKKTLLDKQNLQLQEQINDKRTFGYDKVRQRQLSQAIQRHLQISAKFSE